MAWLRTWHAIRSALLVVTAACVVQWLTIGDMAFSQAKNKKQPRAVAANALPQPVAEMRDAILAAVLSGNIDDLRPPLEWNELRPAVADHPVDDPIAYWKSISGDGQGREILAILGGVIEAGHIALPVGKDIENNLVFIWPAFAEMDLATLTPAEEVALYRLVRPAEVAAMREKKKWTWYRLVIGADGTWHAFHKSD